MFKVVIVKGRKLKKLGGDFKDQTQSVVSSELTIRKQNVTPLQLVLWEQNVAPLKLGIDESSN
jgi:hypothetical protein